MPCSLDGVEGVGLRVTADGEGAGVHEFGVPLSSEYGTDKTAQTTVCPWL